MKQIKNVSGLLMLLLAFGTYLIAPFAEVYSAVDHAQLVRHMDKRIESLAETREKKFLYSDALARETENERLYLCDLVSTKQELKLDLEDEEEAKKTCPDLFTKAESWRTIEDGHDLYKLARSIAVAETGDCTTGSGITHNNCFGIMIWKNGPREPRRYATKEESYKDFYSVWSRSYKVFPNEHIANRWTGGHDPDVWLNNVLITYNNL